MPYQRQDNPPDRDCSVCGCVHPEGTPLCGQEKIRPVRTPKATMPHDYSPGWSRQTVKVPRSRTRKGW